MSESLSFLNLPDGLELVPEQKRPIQVTILRAGETGPNEPAFVVDVNRITVDDFRKINRAVQAKLQGVRPGPKASERANAEFAERYAKKVFAGWSGLTIKNFNAIKSLDARLGGEREGELIASGWQMPFSHEAAAWLLRVTWQEDFDTPVYNAVKRGVDEAIEEDEGNANG